MSTRVYLKREVASFLRASEANGAFSNMHGGFPLRLAGLEIPSTENYYQAMRFPHLPEVQEEILAEKRPVLSKRLAYRHIEQTRSDWHRVKIAIMRHALRLKYGHHPHEFSRLFMATGDRPIVEISSRDSFWGARDLGDRLEGQNILGRLWMELRAEVADHDPAAPYEVAAPNIPDRLLCGRQIQSFIPEPVTPDQAAFDI